MDVFSVGEHFLFYGENLAASVVESRPVTTDSVNHEPTRPHIISSSTTDDDSLLLVLEYCGTFYRTVAS